MVATLQKGTAGPVYQQLQSLLRERIAAGAWQPGQAIPPEQGLAQQYGIARMTLRQALEGLIREGLLVRRRGSGTFVAQHRVERELTRMHGFSEDMRARGMVPSARLLAREVVPAPKAVSEALQLGQREAVIHVHRLRLADALPVALETSYLQYDLFHAVLGADLERGSLYKLIQETIGIRLCFAAQELEAALPGPSESAALEISRRHPVLVIRQTTYVQPRGQEEVPGIFGSTTYRSDRYRFRMHVPR
jgi:GntR family transcriptional regulator